MKYLVELSLRRPVFAWILMSALIIFGAVSLGRLGISQMPDVDFPILDISLSYEGASPEVVEAEIIDRVEERLLTVEGIKEMRSTARQGGGSVRLEFDINRNIDVALQEVQSALSQLRLPTEVDPPVIRKTNPEEQPILFLGVYGDKNPRELVKWTNDFLIDQLQFLPGMGEVSVAGFSQRNLRVWPDPARLAAAQLTVLDLVEAIQTQHLEAATGQFTTGKEELRVRWLGEVSTPEQFGEIRILRRGGAIIHDAVYRIKDVARIEDGLSDVRRLARVNGKAAVAVSIKKQRGGNEVRLAAAVYKKIEELQSRVPEGISVQVNVDFTKSTGATVFSTQEKLVVAAIVTILVCFFFLGNWQAALNILFSIPTSIFGTMIVLYLCNFTLNLFSLLALTLAVSIVVDDAIMLLENIVRHYRLGKGSYAAARDGSIEVMPAAAAATMAVVAIFIPVIFMEGVTGKFFFQFGITMSAAVLLSLVEALTITPMRAAAFLRSEPKLSRLEMSLDHFFERLGHRYRRSLELALRRPSLVVGLSIFLFVGSLFLVNKVRKEFVPAQDQDVVMVSAQTPPGSSLTHTDEKAKELEKFFAASPEVVGSFISIGAGGPAAEVNQIFMPIYLRPRAERAKSHLQIMDEWRGQLKDIKGLKVSLRDTSARNITSGRPFPISFSLTGPEIEVLQSEAKKIMTVLEEEGLSTDLDTDFKAGTPELLLLPDREAMAAYNVSVDTVAKTLTVAVAGLRQSRFTEEGRRFDIRTKFEDQLIKSPQDVENIFVRNSFGNLVPLNKLVTFQTKKSYQNINRINRQRAIGVFCNFTTGLSQSKVLDRARELANKNLPVGYGFQLDGAAAGLSEGSRSLTTALLAGILVAYMILAIQFNSFIHPISVLAALPFSVTGALLVLWMGGISLNLFSYIGLIVLMGISKKNSILLVQYTNQVRGHGKAPRDALLEACPIRLRPILMTSVATVAAAVPLVLGHQIGFETRQAMGWSIIGGTVVSTLLTLFVVPSLYLLLVRLESKHRPQPQE